MSSILRPLQLDESQTDAPVLAKSRRRQTTSRSPLPVQTSEEELGPDSSPQFRIPINSFSLPNALSFIPMKEYLVHLPILLIGLGLYAAVLFVLNTVPPKLIQNIWMQNSYAPFIVLAAAAHFCLFSYLLLNTRRGFLASLYLSILMFLKLQQVLTLRLALLTAVVFVCIELFFIISYRIFLRFRPSLSLPPMGHLSHLKAWSVPFKTKLAHTIPSDMVTKSTLKPLPKPQRQSTRQVRKRKHHFFGK